MSIELAAGVARFLFSRGWTAENGSDAFRPFRAPHTLRLEEDFRLLVPADPERAGAEEFMTRSVTLLSELYSFDPGDLLIALREDATVFTTRITDDLAEHGSLPLDRFDALIDRLKKICLSAATSVLTDDPLDESDPQDASDFIRSCSFLQTRVGSFVSRIKLPNTFALGRTLENQEGVPGVAAAERVQGALRLIFNDVLQRADYIYERDFIEEHQDVMHVPLIRNIGFLLKDTEFQGFEFHFLATEDEARLDPEPVGRGDVTHLRDYVRYVRDILAAGVPINLVGKVTELRSRDVRSSNNHVRVRGYDRGLRREIDLALSLGRASYHEAVDAHGAGRNVEVVGTARRLKSYYKVDDLMSFRVV